MKIKQLKALLALAIIFATTALTVTGCTSNFKANLHNYHAEKYGVAEAARIYGPYKCRNCGRRFQDFAEHKKHEEKPHSYQKNY